LIDRLVDWHQVIQREAKEKQISLRDESLPEEFTSIPPHSTPARLASFARYFVWGELYEQPGPRLIRHLEAQLELMEEHDPNTADEQVMISATHLAKVLGERTARLILDAHGALPSQPSQRSQSSKLMTQQHSAATQQHASGMFASRREAPLLQRRSVTPAQSQRDLENTAAQ